LAGQYRLPEEMRAELAKPLGKLFTPAEISGRSFLDAIMHAPFVVTVGDRVTETVGKLGRVPDVQIVDSLENRKPRLPPDVSFVSGFDVKNPPGGIAAAAVESIRQALAAKKPARLLVDGEEDLLAIPAILLSPEGSSLFYGQPGQGIVMVTADAAAKQRSRTLLRRMGFSGTL
jgi:uncharacterized protein (UPF0218 family)